MHSSVQKPHTPVQSCKLPRYMEGSIGERMEICINSGLPLTMVPCLNQSNVYIKRWLRVWRAGKCIPLIGAETAPTCTGLQTTLIHEEQHRAKNENLRKFRSTYRHGTVYPTKQCLYQKEASSVDIKGKLREWRARKCIPLIGVETALTCTGLQTSPVNGGQYRAENGNLRKFESTYRHSTVKACLYPKEAKGMENSKM